MKTSSSCTTVTLRNNVTPTQLPVGQLATCAAPCGAANLQGKGMHIEYQGGT